MVFRTYKCKKCKKTFDITLDSIFTDKPKEIACESEKCNGKAVYDISELKGSTTIIPEHMRALGKSSVDYNKIPRNKRKYK